MNRTGRLVVFALGAGALVVLFVAALLKMPAFGAAVHPYRDSTVAAALLRRAPNVVTSINFDQRGFDTFGEEAILLTSVIGAVTLLRPGKDERVHRPPGAGRMLHGTRLAGYALLPVS